MCGEFDPQDLNNEQNQRDYKPEIATPKTPTSPLDLSMKKPLHSVDNKYYTSIKSEPSSPMDVSTTSTPSNTNQTSRDISLEKPIIQIQPKPQWHYRSMKDLVKQHIPLISGDGPQRTPVQVKILQRSNETLYLAATVVTHDEQYHDLKVIVPSKTSATSESQHRKNDLNCLIFDACESTDTFDKNNRIVYMEITNRDYQRQLKDVRVHMLNLYQTQYITKELIEAKQLRQCKLAFWFCIRTGNSYIPISDRSYSSIIQEKPSNGRSNALPTAINPVKDGDDDMMTDNDNDDTNSSSGKQS